MLFLPPPPLANFLCNLLTSLKHSARRSLEGADTSAMMARLAAVRAKAAKGGGSKSR